MNSGTENIYWGVLLVFAFFMHHCFYSPIFKKNLIMVLTKTTRMLYNAIKDKKRVISIIWVKRAQTVG